MKLKMSLQELLQERNSYEVSGMSKDGRAIQFTDGTFSWLTHLRNASRDGLIEVKDNSVISVNGRVAQINGNQRIFTNTDVPTPDFGE